MFICGLIRCTYNIEKMEQSLGNHINNAIGRFCQSYADINILGTRSEDLEKSIID